MDKSHLVDKAKQENKERWEARVYSCFGCSTFIIGFLFFTNEALKEEGKNLWWLLSYWWMIPLGVIIFCLMPLAFNCFVNGLDRLAAWLSKLTEKE